MSGNPLRLAKAVIFDFEDTLFARSDWLIPALLHGATELGYDSLKVSDLITGFIEQHGSLNSNFYSHLLTGLGQSDAAVNIRALMNAATGYHAPPGSIDFFPGGLEALRKLRAGMKLAVIIDGPPSCQRAKASALGLYKLVDGIVYSDELGGLHTRKPSREPFRAAISMLRERVAHAVFVGSKPRGDFVAARALGMLTIRVLTGEYANTVITDEEAQPDFTTTSIARVPDLFEDPQLLPARMKFKQGELQAVDEARA
jgi:putative hydrolase of the HAD superfamily